MPAKRKKVPRNLPTDLEAAERRAKKQAREPRFRRAVIDEWIVAPRRTVCAQPGNAVAEAYAIRVGMQRYHDAIAVSMLCDELNEQWAKEQKR